MGLAAGVVLRTIFRVVDGKMQGNVSLPAEERASLGGSIGEAASEQLTWLTPSRGCLSELFLFSSTIFNSSFRFQQRAVPLVIVHVYFAGSIVSRYCRPRLSPNTACKFLSIFACPPC